MEAGFDPSTASTYARLWAALRAVRESTVTARTAWRSRRAEHALACPGLVLVS
eukprot:COSAG03_NODE_22240_length_293_cov_1.340206_1_plen_52_part_01